MTVQQTQSQQKSQKTQSHSTLLQHAMPRVYGLAGVFLAVSISTNALQIQSDLRNAYQTIMGVFVTSDGESVKQDGSNLVMSFNEGGNGTLRFGQMSGDEQIVLTLNARGEILRKKLSELSGSLRDALSGSFVTNNSGAVRNLLSGSVDREIREFLGTGSTGGVAGGLSTGELQQWLQDNFCKIYPDLCPEEVLDPGLSGEDNPLNQYFDINRTTSRPGVPAVNVGGGSTPSTDTTVKDFLEGYFFPDVAVPVVSISSTAAGGEYTNTTPATTTATVTIKIKRTKHPISSANISINNGGSLTPSTIPAAVYNALAVGAEGTFVTTATIPKNTASPTTISVSATDNKGRSANAGQSYSWFQLMYFGLDPDTTLTDAEIRAFPTKPQKSATASNVTYAGAAGYRYAVMPEDLFAGGKNLEVRNAFGIENGWTCTTPTFVNAAGYSTTYRVCRSVFAQTVTQSFTYQFAVK